MPDAVLYSRARSAGLKAKAVWIAAGILAGATIVGAAWRVLSPSHAPQIALAQTTVKSDAPSQPESGTPALPALAAPALAAPQTPVATTTAAPAPVVAPHKPVEIIQQPGPARAVGEKINLNTATADQIALLPGIGPKLAAAIVADRTKNGNFKRVADLDRVKGIGRKKLDAIRSSVTVD